MSGTVVNEAYRKSVAMLRALSCQYGFLASSQRKDNYKRVWARDGVVETLAALASGDEGLIATAGATLRTLKEYQDSTGRIASNVSFNDGVHVSFGGTVGRIDATMWYIIGVCQYALHTGDEHFFAEFDESLRRALFYLECLELNDKGFVYFPQDADWADEYINHGYTIFGQSLYYLALKSYQKQTADPTIAKKLAELKERILVNFFPNGANSDSEYVYNPVLFAKSIEEYEAPLPIAYFTTHSVYHHADNLANALLLHANMLEKDEKKAMQDAIMQRFLTNGYPILPAFNPVITEGDKDWERLLHNYRFEFKNKPYHFHNGGLWPLVHGFFLSTLGKEDGEEYLARFAETLAKDGYRFPEYYHGQTHEPLGTPFLGFSASAYILAYATIATNTKPFIL